MIRSVDSAWRRVHAWRRLPRWILKGTIFAAVVALVLYPRFWLLPTWIARLSDMNRVINPHAPGLDSIEADVRAVSQSNASPAELLKTVESVVHKRIPYSYDWDTWGVMDYLPTTEEALALGREDCDGRAVVAASVLRRMGCEAWLVSDVLHTWVATKSGEAMGARKTEKTLVATDKGTVPTISPALALNAANGLTFGITVFPIGREIVLVATLCVLAMQPDSSIGRRFVGCAMLFAAMLLLRYAGHFGYLPEAFPRIVIWSGSALAIAGWLMLVVRAGARQPRYAPVRPG